jgi:hypothetical protein
MYEGEIKEILIKEVTRYMFLYNDLLLLTNMDKKKCVVCVELDTTPFPWIYGKYINSQKDCNDDFGFQIITENETLNLLGKDYANKKEWIKNFITGKNQNKKVFDNIFRNREETKKFKSNFILKKEIPRANLLKFSEIYEKEQKRSTVRNSSTMNISETTKDDEKPKLYMKKKKEKFTKYDKTYFKEFTKKTIFDSIGVCVSTISFNKFNDENELLYDKGEILIVFEKINFCGFIK